MSTIVIIYYLLIIIICRYMIYVCIQIHGQQSFFKREACSNGAFLIIHPLTMCVFCKGNIK